MLNRFRSSSVALGALALTAAPLSAQHTICLLDGDVHGPGAAFGITSYTCSSCVMSTMRDSAHLVYSFSAEPVVFSVEPGSPIRVGDVVVAVNGFPVTSRAGADRFTYPPEGDLTIVVRRDGRNAELRMFRPIPSVGNSLSAMITARQDSTRRCDGFVDRSAPPYSMTATGTGRGVGGAGGYVGRVSASGGGVGGGRGGARAGGFGGVGSLVTASDSARSDRLRHLIACSTMAGNADDSVRATACRDSMRLMARPVVASGGRGVRGGALGDVAAGPASLTMATSASVDLPNFGLSLTCRPACTRARTNDGVLYWKFDGYPAVGAPAHDGLAARAGLREGDVVVSVNGASPLTEEGALLLNRSEKELTLNLEISRAGKRQKITLKL